MIKILFICHGNICRSPMAEFVMKDLVRRAELEEQFYIASAATSTEEIGNDIHYGTGRKLAQEGIPVTPRGAIQLTRADYGKYDYLIGMDSANIRNMNRMLGGDPEGKIYKLLSFAGKSDDIADPWYTGNFDETYEDILLGCQALLKYIRGIEKIVGEDGLASKGLSD
ncbi:MAG: low molecular weight phosphotyrosine protein phosphatase [Roseburia sp.]|nr:low molecular weight phosphotyrosine protein phosphatase [Roseburia sp.]